MVHQTETFMPREAMPEAEELFDVTAMIPQEMQHDVVKFLLGVNFGLGLAASRQTADQMARQSSA